jgi:hypothetical protein
MVCNSHSAADVQFARTCKTGPRTGRDPDLLNAGEGQYMVALAQ